MPLLYRVVPPRQISYIRSHPLALCFAAGVALVGAFSLVGLTATSSAAFTLPDWLRAAFNCVWVIGGAASVIGIVRGRRGAEGGGMALLATGMSAYFLLIAYANPRSAFGGSFIAFLALGCWLRVKHLASSGYDVTELRVGKK